MKKINRLILLVTVAFIFVMCLVNIYIAQGSFKSEGREYRVSINRIEKSLVEYEKQKGKAPANLEELVGFAGARDFAFITNLYALPIETSTEDELIRFVSKEENDYVILTTNTHYYRVTYHQENTRKTQMYLVVNGIAALLFIILIAFLLYIRQKILLPFYKLSAVPYELSKGNLTVPLQENKNRFFGKFVWGMDMLREHLEENKMKELELQKEKKLLLLSLSHDIKTPLSAIKLYAKAMSKNLYQDETKKQEIAGNINEKVDEIEGYISEIVRASNEDFLQFDVNNREFYVAEVIESVREYYSDKMALNRISFIIDEYRNCLVYGDADRLVEVLQNIIENAIKYGDGKRIRLEMCRDQEEYRIKIYNTGCELERKELPHIFDSFFRGSNVEKKPGSGLGLYICRQLMHLMDGEIIAAVESEEDESMMMVQVAVRLV